MILFLIELGLICLQTGIDISSIQLNGFNYGDRTQIFLFEFNHLFAHNELVLSIAI